MIDPKFVRMLRCPIDKTPLEVAGAALVDAINQAITRGDAFDRIDQKVEQTIDGGLCSGAWLYPIRDNIPSLVADEAITRFVVGLPVHSSGVESQLSTQAREFGKWLKEVTRIDVVFFDERFTTHEAQEQLLAAGLSKKQRKSRLDQLAAQIMLSAYLESGATSADQPGGLEDP